MSSAEPSPPGTTDRSTLLAVVVIAFGVLSTTLPLTQMLGRIPIQNLLKNALHADRAANAAFFFWTTLPWYFKPLVGMVSDSVPLFGSRRKSYLLFGAALSVLAWFALLGTPQRYLPLLATCFIINVAMMIASTTVGGYMVEVARSNQRSGRLTSVRNFVEQLSYVISGPAAGLLGSIAFAWTAVTCGALVLLVVPVAIWWMREDDGAAGGTATLPQVTRHLGTTLRSRDTWLVAAIAALFYFAPGIATALFYRQQNLLHLGTRGQGFLVFLNGVFGVLAAVLYGTFAARRFTLRTLLVVCLLFGAAGDFGYFFYSSVPRAWVIDSCWGFGYTLAEVALMHLMVRASPRGGEAFAFALLVAVRNVCLYGADWFGAGLMDRFHVQFRTLVTTNALTSLLAVPLVWLLPAALVSVRDARVSAAREPPPAPLRTVQE